MSSGDDTGKAGEPIAASVPSPAGPLAEAAAAGPYDWPELGEPVVEDAPAAAEPPHSTRELIMSGMYSMGDRVSALIFGFGTLWMLTRLTVPELFGVWVFFQMVTATFEVARQGLIQNGLIRYLTVSDRAEHGAIHGGAWLLNGTLAVAGSALLYFGGDALATYLHYPGLDDLTDVYALTFLVMTPLWQFNYVQQAHLEFRGAFWATIFRYATMFGLVAAVFFELVDVDAGAIDILLVLAWGQLIAAAFGTAVSFAYARRYIPAEVSLNWRWARKLIDFGKYVFGTNLSSMLYKQVDAAMLGFLLVSSAPTAIYGLAIRITNFVDVPTLAVASIVFPESSRRSNDEADPRAQARMYEQAVAAILAAVLPALLVVASFPAFFVELTGGSQYTETIPVLQVTVLFSLFIPFANQFGTLLDASGNPKLNFLFTSAGMLLNVVVNYLFIKRFGVIGAPLGPLMSYAIMFAAMQYLLNRYYDVRLAGVARALPQTYVKIYNFALAKLGLRA